MFVDLPELDSEIDAGGESFISVLRFTWERLNQLLSLEGGSNPKNPFLPWNSHFGFLGFCQIYTYSEVY